MEANTNLSIKSVRAGYGNLDILNGVDLEVPGGQFVALMGPNGAGKSTLLKTLYGMTTIKEGGIDWRGKNIAGSTSRAILGEGISFVPQGRCNFPVMTVDENLQMAAYTIRDAKVKADRDYVYDLFPILKTRRSTLAGNMSGGEQQLLEVAMAVLQRPKVLLVDEPSVGLSPAAIGIVFDEAPASACQRHDHPAGRAEHQKGNGGGATRGYPPSWQGDLGRHAGGDHP